MQQSSLELPTGFLMEDEPTHWPYASHPMQNFLVTKWKIGKGNQTLDTQLLRLVLKPFCDQWTIDECFTVRAFATQCCERGRKPDSVEGEGPTLVR
jgi:hypothetical protein